MSVTVTLTFATLDEATAFLTGKPSAPEAVVAPPAAKPAKPEKAEKPVAATPAPTPPTAEAAPADAPAARPIDFEADVVESLKAYAKRVDPNVFKEYVTSLKVNKIVDLKTKPEMWAAIVAHCNA